MIPPLKGSGWQKVCWTLVRHFSMQEYLVCQNQRTATLIFKTWIVLVAGPRTLTSPLSNAQQAINNKEIRTPPRRSDTETAAAGGTHSHPAPQITQVHTTLTAQLALISALEREALNQLHREWHQPGLQEAILPPRAVDGGRGEAQLSPSEIVQFKKSLVQDLVDADVLLFGTGQVLCKHKANDGHTHPDAGAQSQIESHPSERKKGRHTHRHTHTPKGHVSLMSSEEEQQLQGCQAT